MSKLTTQERTGKTTKIRSGCYWSYTATTATE